MGQQVRGERELDVAAETVWSIITDLEAYPDWTEGVREVVVVERDADDYPLRARFALATPLGDIGYTLGYRYDDSSMRWTLIEGSTVTRLDGGYTVEALGADRTRVVYELEADVDLPVPGILKQRAARSILEQGLDGLARRVAELA
jgi:ribosome-associated toxin RatA of RatAB toxin-antitoxin module